MKAEGNSLHRRALIIAGVHFGIVVVLFLCSVAESSMHASSLRATGETPGSPFFTAVFAILLPIAWLLRAFGAEFGWASFIPIALFSAATSALLYGYVLASLSFLALNRNA